MIAHIRRQHRSTPRNGRSFHSRRAIGTKTFDATGLVSSTWTVERRNENNRESLSNWTDQDKEELDYYEYVSSSGESNGHYYRCYKFWCVADMWDTTTWDVTLNGGVISGEYSFSLAYGGIVDQQYLLQERIYSSNRIVV